MSCLDGEVKKLLEGFAIDNHSYKKVWKILEYRYGNPQIILATLYDEFEQLSPNQKFRLFRAKNLETWRIFMKKNFAKNFY